MNILIKYYVNYSYNNFKIYSKNMKQFSLLYRRDLLFMNEKIVIRGVLIRSWKTLRHGCIL